MRRDEGTDCLSRRTVTISSHFIPNPDRLFPVVAPSPPPSYSEASRLCVDRLVFSKSILLARIDRLNVVDPSCTNRPMIRCRSSLHRGTRRERNREVGKPVLYDRCVGCRTARIEDRRQERTLRSSQEIELRPHTTVSFGSPATLEVSSFRPVTLRPWLSPGLPVRGTSG